VGRERVERLAGLDKNRPVTRRRFIAPHHHVDVERIEFDAATDATGRVGGDEGRTRSEKRVDNEIAPVGEVEERILEHGGRFDGWMAAPTGCGFHAREEDAPEAPDGLRRGKESKDGGSQQGGGKERGATGDYADIIA
jgi:hypothetical protein